MRMTSLSVLLLTLLVLVNSCSPTFTIGEATPSKTMDSHLPHSIKGYELYSWQTNNLWHFTLITGTNRLKVIEEITSGENAITTDGWVRISVQGVDAIKAVLSRLPMHEELFWVDWQWLKQAHVQTGSVVLPPSDIIDVIKGHCQQLNVRLRINA